MASVSAGHGLGDSFTYPFDDPRWAYKLLIAGLLMLANLIIPILPAFFLGGYSLEIMRGIIGGDGRPALPEWQEWGRLFVDGARLFLIGILYMLPVVIFTLLGFGLILLPTLLAGVDSAGQDEISTIPGLLPVLPSLGGVLVIGLAVLLGIILALTLPIAVVHYAIEGRFAAAFRIGDWWKIVRANFADFLFALAILLVVSLLSGLLVQLLSLTVIFCMVIPFIQSIVGVYTLLVSSALFAHAYRGGVQKLERQP